MCGTRINVAVIHASALRVARVATLRSYGFDPARPVSVDHVYGSNMVVVRQEIETCELVTASDGEQGVTAKSAYESARLSLSSRLNARQEKSLTRWLVTPRSTTPRRLAPAHQGHMRLTLSA